MCEGVGREVLGGMLGDMGDGGGCAVHSFLFAFIATFSCVCVYNYPSYIVAPGEPLAIGPFGCQEAGWEGGRRWGGVGSFWRCKGPGACRALGGYRPPSSPR